MAGHSGIKINKNTIISLKNEFENIIKRRDTLKTTESNVQQKASELLTDLKQIQKKLTDPSNIENVDNLSGNIVGDLKKKLADFEIELELVQAGQKEVQSAISKAIKATDKTFNSDLSKLLPQLSDPLPREKLYHVIIEHLYRLGRVSTAELLSRESGHDIPEKVKAPLLEILEVVEQLKEGKTELALRWCEKNTGKQTDGLEFDLHMMSFSGYIVRKDIGGAIEYSRTHFGKFVPQYMKEIQHMMGSLVFAEKGLQNTPYTGLLVIGDTMVSTFMSTAMEVLNKSTDEPLDVCVNAGATALPTLLKASSVIPSKNTDTLVSQDQLPVEVDMGPDYTYHSIFTCPVSKEQATDTNPPMLLPCGHVLCMQSVQKISRGVSQQVKCPYCPSERPFSDCRIIHF